MSCSSNGNSTGRQDDKGFLHVPPPAYSRIEYAVAVDERESLDLEVGRWFETD